MKIRIKSHLLAEIITLMISAFVMSLIFYQLPAPFPADVKLYKYFMSLLAILGFFNTIYLFAQLCSQHGFTKARHVVLWLVSFPLQWQLFACMTIPLIIVEIIMLCMGREHIDSGKGNIKIDDCDEELTIMNIEEQTLYNDFVKGYQMRNIIPILMLLFIIIFCNITGSTNNVFVILVEFICFFVLIIIVPAFIRMKYTAILIKKIYAKVENECDSKTYYHVSKALCEKYPSNTILLEHYFNSLQLDNNDYSELKRALKHFSDYQKEVFYKLAYMRILPNEEKKKFFDQYYEIIKKPYERAYQKTKKTKYFHFLISLETRRLELNGKYEESLKLYDSIKEDGTKRSKVTFAFNKALCLKHLGRQKECEELLAYVVKEGNTLRVKYEAEE